MMGWLGIHFRSIENRPYRVTLAFKEIDVTNSISYVSHTSGLAFLSHLTYLVAMKFLVSESWLYLKPNVDVNYNKEKFEGYYERCKSFFKHIPKEVLGQWIHPFHDDLNTLINYAWIEYWEDNVTFDLVQLPKYEFQKIYTTENCSDYYISRSTFKSWDEIILGEDDLNYWLDQGTWSLPPIIMDTETFKLCDEHISYKGKFQLIEGHTRIGILNTLINLGESSKASMKELHWVYIMSCRKNNN